MEEQLNEVVLPFPFEFDLENSDKKKLFLDTVEKVLVENLQKENSFGCKICNCHTHVGSERHLSDFIEAELLFHNSYYNKGFALLTAKKILQWMRSSELSEQSDKLLLVGYENFSELYLCETVDVLNKSVNKINAKYCVYENIGRNAEIRKLENLLRNGFLDENTKVVFVIPISTTFTTFQKLIMAFKRYLKDKGIDTKIPNEKHILNISLIVIAQDDGVYWEKYEDRENVICLSDKLFRTLPQRKVEYFSYIQSKWYPLEKCPLCFPDIEGKELTKETPLFGVNRASVVPMLQLENWKEPKPFSPERLKRSSDNLNKVIRLSKYMYEHHLQRNGNHFQYYFDTETFFEEEKGEVESWLENVVREKLWKDLKQQSLLRMRERHVEKMRMFDRLALKDKMSSLILDFQKQEEKNYIEKVNENEINQIVYDFLVAPRHYSNAGFVHAVNNCVFRGTARIFYFDVQKEFRGNVNAKYSDFQRYVSNIKNSRQRALIRFHFVDDTIYSSGNFMRAKSLISTLAGVSDEYCEIQLYASVILLLGRNSKGTQEHLLGRMGNFFQYTHLAISPMRNHEDACTLCLLQKNYRTIKNFSVTNRICKSSVETLNSHKLKYVQDIVIPFNEPSVELRLRLIIAHMLGVRLSNQFALLKKDVPVNREDEDEDYAVLKEMWENLVGNLKPLLQNESQIQSKDFSTQVKVAFIKVITRPFFSFHIRQKQAAFRFCLEKMEEMLNKESRTRENREIMIALMNGLADMDANYLVRQETIERILNIMRPELYFKAIKKLLTLSQGDTKSLLLESILTSGNEKTFFSGERSEWTLNISIENWLFLYLENNQILIKGFPKWKEIQQSLGENSYGTNNFRKCLAWNGIENIKRICEQYDSLMNALPQIHEGKIYEREEIEKAAYKPDFIELEKRLNTLLDTENSFFFVEDTEHQNIIQNEMDKYILLNDSEEGKKSLYTSSMQKKIDTILNGENSCMEVGGTFLVPYSEEFYLICITAYGEDEYHDEENENGKTLYIYIPNTKLPLSESDKEIYNYKEKLAEGLPFLARIKILLSLRNQFELLIGEYFGNVINLIRNEQMKKALSISKATGHGVNSVMQCLEIESLIEVVTKQINIMDEEQSKMKRMFDKYIQLLSNNFISEIYRMIHTGELEENEVESETWICPELKNDVYGCPEYMIFLHSFLSGETKEPSYEFMAPRKSRGEVKIQFRLCMKKGAVWRPRYLHRYNASDSANFKIIILLACNVAYHSESEDEILMEVYKEGKYLCFKNLWDKWDSSEDCNAGVQEIRWKIDGQLEVHPSRRGEGAGISLWSLKRYCEILNRGTENSFLIDSMQDPKTKQFYFIVKMKLF